MGAELFNANGTYSWIAPLTGSVTVLCVGAGGGAGSNSGGAGGGGGGGGESATKAVNVTLGTTYAIVVGAGGLQGDNAGGNSTFGTTTVVAVGGSGGTNGSAGNPGVGGAGGTGGTGDTLYDGGAGGGGATDGNGFAGGGGGGGADGSGAGNAGTQGANGLGGAGGAAGSGNSGGTGFAGGAGGVGGNAGGNNGANGSWPGGGGGGCGTGIAIGGVGGFGADGMVLLTYADPTAGTPLGLPLFNDAGNGGPVPCANHGRQLAALVNSLARQGLITLTAQGEYTLFGAAAGIIPVAGGGTGDATLAAHGVLLGEGTSPVASTAAGTSGQALVSNGAAADPTFQAVVNSFNTRTGAVSLTAADVDAALPADVVVTDAANTFTANQTIDATHHLLLAEMTPGSVLFAGTSGQVSQNNAKLFYDNANNLFGVGTNSPFLRAHVAGSIEVDGSMLLNQASAGTANTIYVGSQSSGAAVDNTFGFMVAGFGSGFASSQGPYFGARGNLFTAVANQRGNAFMFAGAPGTPGTTEGQVRMGVNDTVTLCLHNNLFVGIGTGTAAPNSQLHALASDAATTTVTTIVTVGHHSSGTPAVGFGSALVCQLDSSTTANRQAARTSVSWVVATDASRTVRSVDYVSDANGEREVVRRESSGSAAMIGFFGTTAIVQQSGDVATALSNYGLVTSPVYTLAKAQQVPAGTGSALARLGGAVFDHYADGATTHTDGTEDTLYSDTVAASTLGTNGDKVTAFYGGTFVSSATATREVKVYFGGTAIFDTGALTLSLSSAWTVYVEVVRKDSATVRYMVTLATEGAALSAYTSAGELGGLTLSGANVIKVTGIASGVGAAVGDITAKLGSVSWVGAA